VVHGKPFFSFLRPSSTTISGKTTCMVARDVVHDEFLGVSAKATQIRIPPNCRARWQRL
jgi:hypothetical protein